MHEGIGSSHVGQDNVFDSTELCKLFCKKGVKARRTHQYVAFRPCDQVTCGAKAVLSMEATMVNPWTFRYSNRHSLLCFLELCHVSVPHVYRESAHFQYVNIWTVAGNLL
jgi:hypothetical protein